MAAADVGQGFEPMPGQGVSDSWVEQKRNVKRIFNLMMEAVNTDGHACNGKYPNTFDALTAVDATSKELWGLFATWLSTGYVTNKNRAPVSRKSSYTQHRRQLPEERSQHGEREVPRGSYHASLLHMRPSELADGRWDVA